MPQCRLHWLRLRLSFYVASSCTHTHMSIPPAHTHTHLLPFAPQSCCPIRFYVASAVAASALKQLSQRVALVAPILMTVTTACNMLSTRHAKILQHQWQHLLRFVARLFTHRRKVAQIICSLSCCGWSKILKKFTICCL